MEIRNSRVNGYPFLEVSGRVDLHTSSKLRSALNQWVSKKASCVLVEVDNVSHMDTSGVATLIECQREMKEQGGKLLLVGVNHHVGEALSLAGVEDDFEVFQSRQQAAEELPAE